MRRIMGIIVSALVDIVCFLQGCIILAYALLHISYKIEVVRGEGINQLRHKMFLLQSRVLFYSTNT